MGTIVLIARRELAAKLRATATPAPVGDLDAATDGPEDTEGTEGTEGTASDDDAEGSSGSREDAENSPADPASFGASRTRARQRKTVE